MATTKLLNPRTWFTSQLDTSATTTTTALSPSGTNDVITDERGKDAEVVSGTFIPTINATGNTSASAQAHTERIRQTIESFNEDKQTPLKWAVVCFFTVLSYLAPILIAWVVGMAIGDAWSGKFSLNDSWNVYSHAISIVLEMMLPALGYAVTVALKQAFNDKSKAGLCIVLSLLFLSLAVGNSFAQMYLIEGHIKLKADDTAGHISMIFRSFTPLVVDVISTIFLSVVTVRSLQKFIKDMQQKEVAIQSVARSEIAVETAFDQAAIDKENAKAIQERTRMDNELLRELTRKRNRDTVGGDDSGGKGRYGGGW
jgi:hypothetical protein